MRIKLYLQSIKCLIFNKLTLFYDNFRMQELCYRMKHCNYKVDIDCYERFEEEVGKGTAYRIFEDMMEECYADPRSFGYPVDREGGNWEFSNHRHFCNDKVLVEFSVKDGNCSGTVVENFEVIYGN